jgi:hypothetical protein
MIAMKGTIVKMNNVAIAIRLTKLNSNGGHVVSWVDFSMIKSNPYRRIWAQHQVRARAR